MSIAFIHRRLRKVCSYLIPSIPFSYLRRRGRKLMPINFVNLESSLFILVSVFIGKLIH